MDYFASVQKLSTADKQQAYDIYESWVTKRAVRPAMAVKSSSVAKQQAMLKMIGLLSIAGPKRHELLNPGLVIVQMARRTAAERIAYRNLIMSELKRIPGVKACVDPDGPDHTKKTNLLRVIMVRDKLGGDSKFGSNFIASIVHVFPGSQKHKTPPEMVVYNLAFKQMPMSPHAKQEEFRDANAMQELRIMQQCTKLVEQGVCPNLPIVYKHWICDDCFYWNPKLKKKGVPKRCLMVANELSTGGDLKHWMLKTHSQVAWQSCIFQILAGLVAFHNVLGYQHDDMHHGNVLYDVVKPGGYWHYRFLTSKTKKGAIDMWIPNTGQLWKLWDFGLANKMQNPKSNQTRQELACDAFRILGIITDPEGREKGMPSRSIKDKIADMVDKYEDTGICDEDMDIDEDALPDFRYAPAFEIMMKLKWFKTKRAALNAIPFTMPVY